MKYDFELDMSTENTLSIILRNIMPNSTILEFGPATGRMTKYLKHNLNCKVYTVEIDEQAAKKAAEYSESCLVGNIEEYKWMEEFKDIKFDYIIFADVLEHLYSPQDVLQKSAEFLKLEGSVFISIPNIAHNSVIINLINNKFEYTQVGLLDNTHIRFFTYDSLLDMIYKTNLVPIKQMATYSKVGENEIKNGYEELEDDMVFSIKNRPYSEVYQFVFELNKKSYIEKERLDIEVEKNIKRDCLEYSMQLFIDTGAGLTESQSIIKKINIRESEFIFNLSNFKNVSLLRLDPLEASCVIKIKNLSVIDGQTQKAVRIINTNARFVIDDIYVFNTDDPQIYVDVHEFEEIMSFKVSLEFVELETKTKPYNLEIYDKLNECIKVIQEKNHIIEMKEELIIQKDQTIKKQEDMLQSNKQQLEKVEKRLTFKEKFINFIKNE